ncbi:MAG: ABC transporter ATP-binding protein [Bacillota bacterium]
MNKKYILEIEGLNKFFGSFQAVKDLNLKLEEGDIFALLGHNGAGKSTLIKMLLGLVNPSGGKVTIGGIQQDGRNRAIKYKIGYLPERMYFYDNLTAWETIVFYAKLKNLSLARCEEVLKQVGLTEFKGRRVGAFSKGMQQRLGLAQAIIHKPELLILDEPTTGLDPIGIIELKKMIRQWNDSGVTILFSTHNLADAEELADNIGIINKAEMIAIGTQQQLEEQLSLKTKMTIKLACSYPQLWQLLMAKGIGPLEVRMDSILLTCHREEKAKVLKPLMEAGITISDIIIEEPSLDEIYRVLVEKANIKNQEKVNPRNDTVLVGAL